MINEHPAPCPSALPPSKIDLWEINFGKSIADAKIFKNGKIIGNITRIEISANANEDHMWQATIWQLEKTSGDNLDSIETFRGPIFPITEEEAEIKTKMEDR